MDYFEFYTIPISFKPDTQLLKQKFYELSKKYHPDFYANSSKEKQQEVLELSTLNNKAYQVLSDPQQRLQYMLTLHGLLTEGESYALPQDFLMDMMELNEALMDLQFNPDALKLADIKNEVSKLTAKMQEELDRLTVSFENDNKDAQLDILTAVRDLYYRRKYLQRINDSAVKLEAGS